MRYICDVATGEEFAEPQHRLRAAEYIADRVYGKAPETMQVEGASAVMDLLVAMAKPVTPQGTDDP